MEWIELKTLYTIAHIFGAVLGAGAAFVSDALFFASARDRVFRTTELRFLRICSTFVWIGLGLLLISGALLFSLDPAGYLASDKFLIKMVVVLTLTVNGVIFHVSHIPRLMRHEGEHYPSSEEFRRAKPFLIASGTVSATSWALALVLGLLPTIPIPFLYALVLYLTFEVVAVILSIAVVRRFI
jgi:hypothetical protein